MFINAATQKEPLNMLMAVYNKLCQANLLLFHKLQHNPYFTLN